MICGHYGYLLLAALEYVETSGEDRLTEIQWCIRNMSMCVHPPHSVCVSYFRVTLGGSKKGILLPISKKISWGKIRRILL